MSFEASADLHRASPRSFGCPTVGQQIASGPCVVGARIQRRGQGEPSGLEEVHEGVTQFYKPLTVYTSWGKMGKPPVWYLEYLGFHDPPFTANAFSNSMESTIYVGLFLVLGFVTLSHCLSLACEV